MKKGILALLLFFTLNITACQSTEVKMPKVESEKQEVSAQVTDNSKEDIKLKPRIVEREPTAQEKEAYHKADIPLDGTNDLERVKLYDAYIKKYPNSPLSDNVLIFMGNAYDRLGEYDKALETYKKVKDIYPASDSVPHSLYEIAHKYFYRFSDYDNAKLYYEQFLEEATEKERYSTYLKNTIHKLANWDNEVKEWEETKEKERLSPSSPSDKGKPSTTTEADVSLNLYKSGDYLIVSGRVKNSSASKRTLLIYIVDAVGSQHFVDAIYAKSYESGAVKSTIKTSKAGPPPYKIFYEWQN